MTAAAAIFIFKSGSSAREKDGMAARNKEMTIGMDIIHLWDITSSFISLGHYAQANIQANTPSGSHKHPGC